MLVTASDSALKLRSRLAIGVFVWALMLNPCGSMAAVYVSQVDFIASNFDEKPVIRNIWLNDEHQSMASKLLGHRYAGLRIRYWRDGEKTAWILGEVGKERPITIGVIIDKNVIDKVVILEFRESRGGEIRHPFFTRQFTGLFLKENMRLSARIDGITGATLSVRAVSNVSRYVLYLHKLLAMPLDGSEPVLAKH